LITLKDACLLDNLLILVKTNRLKIPEGVYRELLISTDILARTLEKWIDKYPLVVKLDYNALTLFPDIERKYGPQFNQGGKVYPGFWKSASGKRSVDSQVVALAKARGWIVISNDNSVHGACMMEGVICRRWEEIGRLILKPGQPQLPGFL
jgi:hypothetical protein